MTNKKRIILAEVPANGELYGGAPMSLLYAGAVLVDSLKKGEVAGVSVEDVSVHKPQGRENLEELLLTQPKIAGLSVTTYSADVAHGAVQTLRERIPETVVIAGGPHYDGIVDEWRASPNENKPFDLVDYFPQSVDVVITGDGEFALDRVSKVVNEVDRIDLAKVFSESQDAISNGKGDYSVWFRDEKGALVEIPSRYRTARFDERSQFSLDLDELPIAPRELLDEKLERAFSIFSDAGGNPLRTAQVKTYRGCDFAPTPTNACSFCYVGSKYKRGGIDKVVDEIRQLGREGYKAIFFDDGVFTSRAPRRKQELEAIVGAMREAGIEQAGFQTRVDFMDDDIMQILTSENHIDWYCAVGVESTEQGILDSVGKKQSKIKASQAFDLLQKYNMRTGVYLLFGARGEKLGETTESKQSAKDTIDFLADYVRRGHNIVSVLPGLDMILPGTKDATSYRQSQHQKERPLVYGIMQNGKPWDTFEGGRGFHHIGVSDDLARFISEYGHEMLGDVWEALPHNDLYIANPQLFQRYRRNELTADDPEITDFNSAMLGKPRDEVREAVAVPFHVAGIERKAREYAARIVNLQDSRKVLFARNTTEAVSLVATIADAYRGNVVISDMEVPSVRRVFEQHMDHGNTNQKDAWSTFADSEVSEDYEGFAQRELTDVELRTAQMVSQSYDVSEIVSKVDSNTSAVVVSHVDRHTGRIINVAEVARQVKERNPNAAVIVDGAQALGKLSEVNFEDLESAGVDAYVATPHKNLGAYPVGIAYISEKLQARVSESLKRRTPLEQVIMDEMFDASYGVEANVETSLNPKRFVSLVKAIDTLQEEGHLRRGNFGTKSQYLEGLKSEFKERLHSYEHEIVEDSGEYSSGVMSFRFIGQNQREVVKEMQERGIFSSYIPEVDAVRVSFETANSRQDVQRYFSVVDDILGYERPDNVVALQPKRNRWLKAASGIAAAAAIALSVLVPNYRSSVDTVSYASAQKWFDHLQQEGIYPDLAMRMYRPDGDRLVRN